MSEPTTVKVRIQRYSPDGGAPGFKEYDVPFESGMSVMNVLTYIYENLDSSIAHYTSCRIGKCLGCDVGIDGVTHYACTTPVKGDLTITALPEYIAIKDLLIDRNRPKRPAGRKPVVA